jgi:biopolymer transport protein ExbD
MSQEKGLKAQIPQPRTRNVELPLGSTVVIQVCVVGRPETARAEINEENVAWNQLHDRLFEIFKQRAERVAFVKGDDDVDFQYVA